MVWKKKKKEDCEYRSVKSALGSVIRQPYRLPLIQFISEMSIQATWIALLASLLFLFKVNRIYFFLFFRLCLIIIELFRLFLIIIEGE